MLIYCDFMTSNPGAMENHLKLFHNINIKSVAGGSSGNGPAAAMAGAPTSFRLKQSNDIPPKMLPENPSKKTILDTKIAWKYHGEVTGLMQTATSKYVEYAQWQGMINLFRHLLTESQWNMQFMRQQV